MTIGFKFFVAHSSYDGYGYFPMDFRRPFSWNWRRTSALLSILWETEMVENRGNSMNCVERASIINWKIVLHIVILVYMELLQTPFRNFTAKTNVIVIMIKLYNNLLMQQLWRKDIMEWIKLNLLY